MLKNKKVKSDYISFLEANKNSYAHPDDQLIILNRLIKKIGTKKFLSGAGYNKERELFIGTFFAYSIRELSKKEYFLRPSQKEPPDIELLYPKGNKTVRHRIEIVEVPLIIDSKEDKSAYMKLCLEKKFSPKYKVPPKTILLVFLNTEIAASLLDALYEFAAIENNGKYSSIWAFYLNSVSVKTGFVFSVASLLPKGSSITLVQSELFGKGTRFPNEETKMLKRTGSFRN